MRHDPASRRAQRGVTMVELMVVIAIVGIAASLAVITTKTDPTAKSARELCAMLQVTRRAAVAHGPSKSSTIPATARLTVTTVNEHNVIQVWDLDDTIDPAEWVLSTQETLPEKVEVYTVDDTANTDGGETLPSALGTGTAEIFFFADGHSDARTFYLQTRNSTTPEKFRVFVMPLAGTATTTKGW